MTQNVSVTGERMVVTRVFAAPRTLVWRAWTDPEQVMQWWGPKGFSLSTCRMDVRVGGRFLYGMRVPDGQEFWTGGEYQEVVPSAKLVFLMYFSDANGNKVEPENYGIEHRSIEDARDITLFEDAGDGETRVTYTGNETMQDAIESGQLKGMEESLDKLAALLRDPVRAE